MFPVEITISTPGNGNALQPYIPLIVFVAGLIFGWIPQERLARRRYKESHLGYLNQKKVDELKALKRDVTKLVQGLTVEWRHDRDYEKPLEPEDLPKRLYELSVEVSFYLRVDEAYKELIRVLVKRPIVMMEGDGKDVIGLSFDINKRLREFVEACDKEMREPY